jgi:hypothetical protein
MLFHFLAVRSQLLRLEIETKMVSINFFTLHFKDKKQEEKF